MQGLLALLLKELIPQLIPVLIDALKSKPKLPSVIVPVLPPGFEEEDIINPKPVPVPVVPAKPIFSASQLNVMDVNGEAYNPGNAINWGSYIRLDSNPKDEKGDPLPKEELAQVESIEWKSLWDGEPDKEGFCHINVGGNLWNQSNGYAVSAKVFLEGRDANRHTLDFWVTYHLKSGKTVDSNEVRFQVD